MGSFLSPCPACSIPEPPPCLNKMDHIESRDWETAVNRTPCLFPLEFSSRWASVYIWKDGSLSRVPEGVMSLSLPIASMMTFPNEKAIQEVVKKQSHLSMLHPGMLQWLNLATSTCQLNPQVTSGHGPQATSCPPWHSFYLPLFKRIHIRCVFYIVRDFLELGVPLPPLPGV